ncbi:MAG: helix-turn-helix transcriptional regulator [Ruminococcus sp.]|nr:helix-turn-helix transcriptional regulator [Ruminococcus sp.]MCM1380471.1 helix-turn-helix transcriptional regulator [Muribaculaceae bacterium]MCM1479548.1 helix-turn-helix transcriptional regulator [Muribaculaceae bacterium]
MNTNERLKKILDERGWSYYKLSKESGLSESTVTNIFKRNTIPSIPTLELICQGFGITLSQFFADGEMVELTPELKQIFDGWSNLTVKQKKAVSQMIDAMNFAEYQNR